jgi:O-antigen/teichoic acid export membrane protein
MLVALPWNNAASIQQAQQRFDRILVFRILLNICFFAFVVTNKYFLKYGVVEVIIALIVSNGISSLVAIVFKWNGGHYLRKADKSTIKKIFNYGKYTVLTSTGSSLLRSADTLIIGLSPVLGATGVAIYSIPFKIIDLIQIPLNSFIAAASPKLSKNYIDKNIQNFKSILLTYTGSITFLFIPVVIITAVWSSEILLLFAGEGYEDSLSLMRSILYIILFYGLMLPIDRFTGVALDSAEMPAKNALKVNVMLLLNLIGNVVAVFVFKSLTMVAAVSVLFTITGIIMGWNFLQVKFKLNPLNILDEGLSFYKQLFKMVRSFKTYQSPYP